MVVVNGDQAHLTFRCAVVRCVCEGRWTRERIASAGEPTVSVPACERHAGFLEVMGRDGEGVIQVRWTGRVRASSGHRVGARLFASSSSMGSSSSILKELG